MRWAYAGRGEHAGGLRRLIDLKEIIVANGVAALMVWFLLSCRRRNRESSHTQDRVYDAMCIVNILGALFETVSFLIDGKTFPGAIALNYLANSLCFLGTVTIGLLWGTYVNMRIFQNRSRTMRDAKFLIIPWAIEAVSVLATLCGTGFLFSISSGNVYQRGPGAAIGYISLMIYFVYSTYVVRHTQKQGVNLHFFPIQYFVGPCVLGVLGQFLCYGITTSWISVAIALTFVQMQVYAENIYRDALSGLFNRRYLDRMLEKIGAGTARDKTLYGIMMDINDFKSINDTFGHSTGDRAIYVLGDILYRSIPEGAMALRYAGDEFIVLLPNADVEKTLTTMADIRDALKRLNDSGTETFTLEAAMGYAQLNPGDTPETFLRHMDERMYVQKRAYHAGHSPAAPLPAK